MSALRKLLARNSARTCLKIVRTISSSDFIVKADLADVCIPQVPIDEFVFSNADKWPKHTAAECGITGRKYSYQELRSKSVNLGRSLRKKLKVEKGDVLAILLPNCPEYALVAMGALKAGLVVTTLNPIYTAEEISRQLRDSSAKIIVTMTALSKLAQNASANIPILTIKNEQNESTPGGCFDFAEFTQPIDFPDLPPSSSEEIAFLPYSSGTTGLPKGVELTHRNIIANMLQFSVKELGVVERTAGDHQDIVPAVLPEFHIYGLVINTLYVLERGARIVTLPKFAPDLYINTLVKSKPSVLFVAPPLVLFLTAHPQVKSDYLQSVRCVVSGAAPLGSLDEDRFLTKINKDINFCQGYGLTETSPVVTMTRNDMPKTEGGSIGKPVGSTQVKIVDIEDQSNTPLGPNCRGELLVKGPQVMKGYHNKPEETKAVFSDGWFRTGDIAYYNENCTFFICDRIKELIKVKGFQVPPAELEEALRDFPNVEEAAVIGIPHKTYGEVPRAYVVPKANAQVDAKEIGAFLAQKVAEYKQLRGGIVIVESIPKNASGKIMRRVLKQQYESTGK